MKIINASYQILTPDLDDPKAAEHIYRQIEAAGRTCYKSEQKITPESAVKFVKTLLKNHHEGILEHASMTVKFTVDRGISHEIVRHRLASYAQESTRYCNYSDGKFGGELTFIRPSFFGDISSSRCKELEDWVLFWGVKDEIETTDHEVQYMTWVQCCSSSEYNYLYLLNLGATPQEARSVLPTSLKTELVMTANLREWRHFLKLRAAGTTGKPHPQMLEVTVPLLNQLKMALPYIFDDIQPMEDSASQ